MCRRVVLCALACCLFAPVAMADVKLPAIISDHCVLQRDTTVPVWGWAAAGEEVTVTVAGQTQTTKADANGKWTVKFKNLVAAEPTTLTVKGKNTLTVNDVLVGEVWLCSGQSNMAWTVGSSKNFDSEKAAATFPKIRQFLVQSNVATKPQEDCKGTWVLCSPETVGGFTAAGYFFGRDIHQKVNVPVGLINSSVGGTPIEAWTSWDAQKNLTELKQPLFDTWAKKQAEYSSEKAQAEFEKQLAKHKEAVEKAKAENKPAPRAPQKPSEPILNNHYPATLYNGKIAPLVPYAIRGAIWYQGESNAGIGQLYGLQLSTMIKDWRAQWGYDFPFAWVQLPDYMKAQEQPVEDGGWPKVREGMLQTLALPKTGMAITIGLGEANDIHPKNKQDVGHRLAMWALGDVYGQKTATCGPLPTGHEIKGDKIVIAFKHTDGGLVCKADALKGFAICGEDKKWVRAEAKIDGDKVVVSSKDVAKPVAVRYAWANNPEFSLFNGAGLPATPFRTDNW